MFERIKQELVHAVALGPVQTEDTKNVLYTIAPQGKMVLTKASGREFLGIHKADSLAVADKPNT